MTGDGEFKGKAVPTLFKDRKGTMWVGVTGAGIFQFTGGKFVQETEATVNALLRDPHCLLVDQALRVWVGAGDDFVLCRDADQWRRYRIPRHLARPYVTTGLTMSGRTARTFAASMHRTATP